MFFITTLRKFSFTIRSKTKVAFLKPLSLFSFKIRKLKKNKFKPKEMKNFLSKQ